MSKLMSIHVSFELNMHRYFSVAVHDVQDLSKCKPFINLYK